MFFLIKSIYKWCLKGKLYHLQELALPNSCIGSAGASWFFFAFKPSRLSNWTWGIQLVNLEVIFTSYTVPYCTIVWYSSPFGYRYLSGKGRYRSFSVPNSAGTLQLGQAVLHWRPLCIAIGDWKTFSKTNMWVLLGTSEVYLTYNFWSPIKGYPLCWRVASTLMGWVLNKMTIRTNGLSQD